MARSFLKKSEEGPSIRTITSASAREYTREFLSPSEMQPYEVAEILGSDIDNGLTKAGVAHARRKYGSNIIKEELSLSFGQSLKKQLLGIHGLLVLLCAVILFIFTPDPLYMLLAVCAAAVTLVNAYLESRSQKAIKSTLRRVSPKAIVIRDGREFSVDSRALVPGDVIRLEVGRIVPADARLIETNSLTVLETPVTRAKASVGKDASYIADGTGDAIALNMVCALSVVTGGSAKAIVTATGKDTAVRLLSGDRTRDPMPALLKYIRSTGRFVSLAAVVTDFVLILLGLLTNRDIVNVFTMALTIGFVSLSDSAFALASAAIGLGMKKASAAGASLKNLNSIAKLCFIDTVMCEKNSAFPPRQLTAQTAFVDFRRVPVEKQNRDALEQVLTLSLVCSNFREKFENPSLYRRRNLDLFYEGSQSDLALIKACGELDIELSGLKNDYFKIETEYTTGGEALRTLVLHEGKNLVVLKGAPEMVVSRCAGYEIGGEAKKMTPAAAKRLLDEAAQLSRESMTVYAVAAGITECDSLKSIDVEKRLIFKGFIGCYMSVYVDSASAVFKCTQAGIEPVVRTDESFYTAVSHAKNAGIITDESQVITGEQLRSMDEGLYIANSPDYKVYRGVTDAEWLRVLRLRKEDGKAVAVTAERMEDLTLMSEADATFVSNSQAPETILQSADVLIDAGGFDVITRVLECARSIYKRVYSVVQYLTVAYAMLVFSALLSLCSGMAFPARVSEIVFAGFGANLLFALALAFAPTHRKILTDRIPRYTARPKLSDFAVPLAYAGGGALALLLSYLAGNAEGAHSRVLVTFVLLLAMFAFSGSSKQSLVTSRAYRNYLLLPALGISLAGMALLLYEPSARAAFGYCALGAADLLTAVGIALLNFVCLQLALFAINKCKIKKSRARTFPKSGRGAAEKENV